MTTMRVSPARSGSTRSAGMSAGLARNWWAIGLRAVVAALFAIGILTSRSTLAALIMMFAGYVAFDGLFAIVAGLRAARRGERWWMFVIEGSINLGAAVAVLAWQAVAAVALVPFAGVWAMLGGGAMLAAASSARPLTWPLDTGFRRRAVCRLGCPDRSRRQRRCEDHRLLARGLRNRLRCDVTSAHRPPASAACLGGHAIIAAIPYPGRRVSSPGRVGRSWPKMMNQGPNARCSAGERSDTVVLLLALEVSRAVERGTFPIVARRR